MEFKRLKLSHPYESYVSITNFLSINVDCMFKIFEFLSIDDLCSVGETCGRLKDICGGYFSRKYPFKSIVLNRNLIRTGKSKDRSVNCFRNYIKNMDVCRYATDDDDENFRSNYKLIGSDKDLLDMIPMYSGGCLTNITFSEVEFPKTFGAKLVNTLQNIESITFLTCSGKDNFYTKILKHCQNLTSLVIHAQHKQNLLLQSFLDNTIPTIKNIEFRFVRATQSFTEKLQTFLLLHPIVTLTWHFTFGSPSVSDKTFVKMIAQSATNLKELYLSFDRYDDLSQICDELKVICDRPQFKRLEIKFNAIIAKNILIQNTGRLESLDSLKGVHLDLPINPKIFARIISPLEQLKTLQLQNVLNGRRWQKISFEKLVNLEELLIHKLESLPFLQQIVRHSPKLKKVIILSCAITLVNFNIFSQKTNRLLNEERKKLDAACNMTIYSNDEWKMRDTKPYTENESSLVKVKLAKFRNDFNLKPFIKWEIDNS